MEPVQWETVEYYHTEKSTDWFWAVSIVAISAAVTAVIFQNVLLAILIIIGAVALIMYAKRIPGDTVAEINDGGILFGDTYYPYANLDSFWVDDEHYYDRLLVKSQKTFMPFIVIPLAGTHPEMIRERLRPHLLEEEHHEPIIQQLMEHFGF